MIENIALALERIEITIERVRDRQRMERERERANLLRAISHDLRTPLSGIMGSAEMLMDMTDKNDKRQNLLKMIYHTILQKIWGDGYGEDTQVLRSVMASTRRKIEKNPAKQEYILTGIGIGYRMRKRDK